MENTAEKQLVNDGMNGNSQVVIAKRLMRSKNLTYFLNVYNNASSGAASRAGANLEAFSLTEQA